jgi:hypothetical protein
MADSCSSYKHSSLSQRGSKKFFNVGRFYFVAVNNGKCISPKSVWAANNELCQYEAELWVEKGAEGRYSQKFLR